MSTKQAKKTAKTAAGAVARKPVKAQAPVAARPGKGSATTPRTQRASGTAAPSAKRPAGTAAKRKAPTPPAKPASRKTAPAKAAPRKTAVRPASRTTVQAKAKAKPARRAGAAPAAATRAARKPAVRFSDGDLNEFRAQLMKLRNDLVGKVAFLRDSSLQREDEVNHAEDGSDAFDRLFSLERADGVQSRIYAIDEALREIDDGTYGICQSCDSLIRKQRLLALPFARNCLACQADQERKRNGQGTAAAPRRLIP